MVIKLEGGTEEDIKLLDAPPATGAGEDEASKEKKANENDEEKSAENGGEVSGHLLTIQCLTTRSDQICVLLDL